jgi:putative resolvase
MYRIGGVTRRIGRPVSTVRRWETQGRITVQRTSTGQRYFIDADVRRVFDPCFDESSHRTVMYCRVSWPSQQDDPSFSGRGDGTVLGCRTPAADEWKTGGAW